MNAGWARSKQSKLDPEHNDLFVGAFVSAVKLSHPVIISASMSGRYSLPFMMKPEPTTCQDRVFGFVPLAPVSTEMFTHSDYHRCEVSYFVLCNSA